MTIIRNPQNPILIVKAPTVVLTGHGLGCKDCLESTRRNRRQNEVTTRQRTFHKLATQKQLEQAAGHQREVAASAEGHLAGSHGGVSGVGLHPSSCGHILY